MNYKDKFVGIILNDAYCNGFFGREWESPRTIIASGDNWIVAKDDSNKTWFADFDNGWEEKMEDLINDWTKDQYDEESI